MEHSGRTNIVDGNSVPILHSSSPKSVIGESTIKEKRRKLAKIWGWDNWEEYTYHGLGALGVTMLHNSK